MRVHTCARSTYAFVSSSVAHFLVPSVFLSAFSYTIYTVTKDKFLYTQSIVVSLLMSKKCVVYVVVQCHMRRLEQLCVQYLEATINHRNVLVALCNAASLKLFFIKEFCLKVSCRCWFIGHFPVCNHHSELYSCQGSAPKNLTLRCKMEHTRMASHCDMDSRKVMLNQYCAKILCYQWT